MRGPHLDFRFSFYERVRIGGRRPSLHSVRGELATVLGRAVGDEGPVYTIHVYSEGECWYVIEDDLEPTGEFDRRETFYEDQASLRVPPNGDLRELTGRRSGETSAATSPSRPPHPK